MNIHTGDISYHCALCGKGFISRNHQKRSMKSHDMDDSYPCACCVEEIYINHPRRHINSHTRKFHITVLFNIPKHGWQGMIISFVCKYCQKYSALVMSSADKHQGIPCYTKCATNNCFLLVETGKITVVCCNLESSKGTVVDRNLDRPKLLLWTVTLGPSEFFFGDRHFEQSKITVGDRYF